MPARDATAGRRRRGRPPRRHFGGRSESVEDDSPAPSDRAQDERDDSQPDNNASENEAEGELPRLRLRRRGRPPKRSVTPSDEPVDSKRRKEESKIRRSTRKRAADDQQEEEEDEEQEGEQEQAKEEQSEGPESDIDEAGETKVDKQGHLSGGREYRVPTFTLPMRGDQLFMFAMEPAKLLNYRDSYLFFHKNPVLERVRLTEEERSWLVEQRLLVHWFRNRDVAVVSARSCFKCFGSRIIKRGKRVRDDYFEARAREMGYTEEADEDVEDSEAEANKTGRRALISRTSRSAGYDATTPVNNATWMHHAALAVRGFNAQLHERRAEKAVFYDVHTNINQIAAATQPTRVKFECVDNKKDEFTLEEMNFEKSPANVFRGVGRDLLDGTYDVNAAVNAVPEKARKSAKALLSVKQPFSDPKDEDEQYPIAIMDGQYQADFPMHPTRFNQPNPKIAAPSAIAASAQSAFAQQHYFNQMYQVMNHQSISHSTEQQGNVIYRPQHPFPPPTTAPMVQLRQTMGSHASPATVPPPLPVQQHPSPPHLPRPPVQHQVPANFSPGDQHYPPMSPHQNICGYQSSKGQICKRAVMFPGEKCQYHAHYAASRAPPGPQPLQPLMTTIHPPPAAPAHPPPPQQVQQQQRVSQPQPQPPQQAPSFDENKCAECHYLSAPSEALSKDDPCDAFSMIKCSKCTRKYHPVCAHLKTPRQLSAAESYPWACPECKVCCVCKSAGDESTLMICDDCDRGWHTGCCNPKVEKVPEGSWLCPLCADCHGCDEQGDKQEYFHALAPPTGDKIKYPVYLATYCGKCFDNFKNDRFCPVCMKTFSEEDENDDEENEMVACDSCDHWIHTGCDETLTPEKYQSLCDDEDAKYTCPLCADSVKPILQTTAATLALKGQAQPSGCCVGIVGGKVKTRGVVRYKRHKVAVPEIKGTGIAEMPSSSSPSSSSSNK